MVQQVGYRTETKEDNKRYQRATWAKKALNTEVGYAVYHKDEMVVVGTAKECADYLGIKINTFFMKQSPSHKARNKTGRGKQIDIVRLDDEEDDDE